MATTYFGEEVPPMRAHDMVHDLVQLPRVLERLAQQSQPWQPLAQALHRLRDEKQLPTGKQLQLELGLSPARFRRWLEGLYSAYQHLLETDADAVAFPLVEHQLILTGRRSWQTFSCRLPVTPRVGEELELTFLRAVTGESTFYVDSITHDFRDGRYTILVYLKAGYHNAYLHGLRQRARFERVLSLHAEFGTPDFLRDDFLRARYPPPPESAAAHELRKTVEEYANRKSGFGRRRKARRRS